MKVGMAAWLASLMRLAKIIRCMFLFPRRVLATGGRYRSATTHLRRSGKRGCSAVSLRRSELSAFRQPNAGLCVVQGNVLPRLPIRTRPPQRRRHSRNQFDCNYPSTGCSPSVSDVLPCTSMGVWVGCADALYACSPSPPQHRSTLIRCGCKVRHRIAECHRVPRTIAASRLMSKPVVA